jgi:hypothetical protein
MRAEIIIKALKFFATPERKKTNEWFFKTGKGEYSEFDKLPFETSMKKKMRIFPLI